MGHKYAATDFHGCWEPFKELYDSLEEDDTLFFLGDAIDRGPDGVKIMDTLLNDKRVIYLKGNHEEFLEQAMPMLMEEDISGFGTPRLWTEYNGGNTTLDALNLLPREKVEWYVQEIKKMPTYVKYKNKDGITIHLCHAGFDPKEPEDMRDYLWDRDHIKSLNAFPQDERLIHGHTPTQILSDFANVREVDNIIQKSLDYKDTALWYCNATKLDIDLCTFVSNKVARVDLDNFDIRYFGVGRQQQ